MQTFGGENRCLIFLIFKRKYKVQALSKYLDMQIEVFCATFPHDTLQSSKHLMTQKFKNMFPLKRIDRTETIFELATTENTNFNLEPMHAYRGRPRLDDFFDFL